MDLPDYRRHARECLLPHFDGGDYPVCAVVEELSKYGRANNIAAPKFRQLAFGLQGAYSQFLFSVCGGPRDGSQAWTNRLAEVRRDKAYNHASLSMGDVQDAASTYLRQPVRLPCMDRALIDALIASEIFAYIDGPAGYWFPRLRAWGVPIWLGLAYLSGAVARTLAITPTYFYAALCAVALRSLHQPFSRTSRRFGAMRDSYRLLAGPVTSVSELREALDRARGIGVVWPRSLGPVLDDVSARSAII